MWGTGSHSGHTVMALRFDGELYIVESQDAWYWPIHRIQRNKFSEWMKMAENCDFHVVYMPLSDLKELSSMKQLLLNSSIKWKAYLMVTTISCMDLLIHFMKIGHLFFQKISFQLSSLCSRKLITM